MSESQPEGMDIQIDNAESTRWLTFVQLLMRDAAGIINRFDGQEAIQVESKIRSLIERAYNAGEEHATTLPKSLAHEPKHRKNDEGGDDE